MVVSYHKLVYLGPTKHATYYFEPHCKYVMKKHNIFPFTGLIGQNKMKSGLILNTVDPGIGGVLISGHKGTGKSTAVRALAQVLPKIESVKGCKYHCSPTDLNKMCIDCANKYKKGEILQKVMLPMPLVELPLNATEDRVVGTLNIEETLKTWKSKFEPGLLAAANRGILYVDEVNLLNDHIVDILLDAAASGVNVVEREGISHRHPARFILVGTMNPEEGELRPQFLDRFGLSLFVSGVNDAKQRQNIVTSRIAFDTDPDTFTAQYAGQESILAHQIIDARERLNTIKIPPKMVELAVTISTKVQVQGHRSDIAIVKTARALAALLEDQEIREGHILEAARFVLPHRISNIMLATSENTTKNLEETLAKFGNNFEMEEDPTNLEEQSESWDEVSDQVPGSNAASNVDMLFSFLEDKKKLFLMQTN